MEPKWLFRALPYIVLAIFAIVIIAAVLTAYGVSTIGLKGIIDLIWNGKL